MSAELREQRLQGTTGGASHRCAGLTDAARLLQLGCASLLFLGALTRACDRSFELFLGEVHNVSGRCCSHASEMQRDIVFSSFEWFQEIAELYFGLLCSHC